MSLSVPPLQGANSQHHPRDLGFPAGLRVRGSDETLAAAPCRTAGAALASPCSCHPRGPSPCPCSAGGCGRAGCSPSLGSSGVSPPAVHATLMCIWPVEVFLQFRCSVWGPGCVAQQVPAWGCGTALGSVWLLQRLCCILHAVPCSSPCARVTLSTQLLPPAFGSSVVSLPLQELFQGAPKGGSA